LRKRLRKTEQDVETARKVQLFPEPNELVDTASTPPEEAGPEKPGSEI
jgi:hypothetical protein